jgi:hypothetical protein
MLLMILEMNEELVAKSSLRFVVREGRQSLLPFLERCSQFLNKFRMVIGQVAPFAGIRFQIEQQAHFAVLDQFPFAATDCLLPELLIGPGSRQKRVR